MKPHDAGHILGSSWLELTITENGKQILVVFSGDIGRYNQPILKDPEPPSRADYLLCESTYGDRDHPTGSVADELASVINDTVKRGGVIVIPAFAVDRTQMLMYYLRELVDQKRIPVLPVYVDSPMAINVTDLYVRHPEDHDSDYLQEEQHGLGDPLNVKLVHLTRTVDDSKRINNVTTPCIIVSASGMATGGRVLHHLAKRLPDPRNTVLLVGYQADGTKGRALQDGAKFITLFGQQVPVRAQVVSMGQLSAHAGKSELLRWLSGFTAPPRQTFLVHGEPVALNSLRDAVTAQFKWPVTIPAYLQTFDLSPCTVTAGHSHFEIRINSNLLDSGCTIPRKSICAEVGHASAQQPLLCAFLLVYLHPAICRSSLCQRVPIRERAVRNFRQGLRRANATDFEPGRGHLARRRWDDASASGDQRIRQIRFRQPRAWRLPD